MMNRAYSILEVKAVDGDKRIITGVATTPTPDRVGDIVEPLGVKFNNPLPLLWQHDARSPVGFVAFKKPTKDGIRFEASLPKIDEAGPLKDRVDTAWAEVKAGLVRGVSIGFRALKSEPIGDQDDDGFSFFGGPKRFLETEVMELSLVTIPANAEATIETLKSFDAHAAIGNAGENGAIPASREKASKPIQRPETGRKNHNMTTLEKIKAFEAKRMAKAARMTEIMDAAGDETLDESQRDEYDGLTGEVKSIDEHLVRLNELAKNEIAKAKPVAGETADEGSNARGSEPVRVSVRDVTLPKGIAFARYARCQALAAKSFRDPAVIARELYPDHSGLHMAIEQKTNVAAGMTSVSGWASQLVNVSNVFADFVEYLRPMTVIGQFGTGGIPSLRRVPFRTYLISQTAGTTGYWVGEAQPKPVSKPTFSSTYLLPYKVAAISVVTMELLRDSSPSVDAILRDDLARAVAARIDEDFLDPQKGLDTPTVGSPASISNGVTAINSSGRDADSVRADIVSAMAAFLAANNTPSSGVWVMSAVTALQLSLLTNALGQPEFPGMRMTGGTLQGLPVITSEFIGKTFDSPTEGRDVFLVNANDIWFADDGGIDIAMSSEAALEMVDNPTNASGSSITATSMVSMFQTNSVAFRAERTVSWARRRSESVQQIAQVEWGEASGVNV